MKPALSWDFAAYMICLVVMQGFIRQALKTFGFSGKTFEEHIQSYRVDSFWTLLNHACLAFIYSVIGIFVFAKTLDYLVWMFS